MAYLIKLKKTLILAFEAHSKLSSENETKIVKITHSADGATIFETFFGYFYYTQSSPSVMFVNKIKNKHQNSKNI